MRCVVVLMPLMLTGCVERMLEIRSDPPGAEIFIDGEAKGITPRVEKYLWYGTREITLVKEGFRSERRMVELDAPWWQVFPFDLITDVFLPFTLTDKTELDIKLHPEPVEARALEDTLERAEEARRKAAEPTDPPK